MLWHYLDESGEHGEGGKLARLTVAGGIADADAWNAFNAQWHTMLNEFGVPEFHMAKFEAWQRPFEFKLPNGKRDSDKHNRLLNTALDLIIKYVAEIVGFVAEPGAGKPSFDDAYEANIAKAVKEAAIDTRHRGEQVTMVFARHRDFSPERIRRFFRLWDDGDGRITFGGVAHPIDRPPLQAADLIAYELSRWGRQNRPEDDRYPLRRLKEAFGERQKVKSGRFILTIIP